MSKAFGTKRRILNLLKDRNMNLTEISDALGLSKATVSQHLSELENMSEIEPIDNTHYKKVKYYKLSSKHTVAPISSVSKTKGIGRFVVPVVIILAAIAILSAVVTYTPSNTQTNVNATKNSTLGNHTVPSLSVAEACPAMIILNHANESTVNTTVSEIANGDPCALAETGNGKVNGYNYTATNGTVYIHALNYTYTINGTSIKTLESGLSNGYCSDGKALEFFGINVQKPSNVTCKNRVFG